MAERSIFFDEWVRCMREQYMYVIRNNDKLTEQSLTGVLYRIGFTTDELRELRLQATMHVDDVPEDFVPDMDILEEPVKPEFQPHPNECTCPDCMTVDETIHDADGQLLDELPEPEGEAGHVFPVAHADDDDKPSDDKDSPQQLSLFG